MIVQGPVGSVHTVRIAQAGRAAERRVAITDDGLIPNELGLTSRPLADGRAAERGQPAAANAVQGVGADPPSGSATVPLFGLSEKFE